MISLYVTISLTDKKLPDANQVETILLEGSPDDLYHLVEAGQHLAIQTLDRVAREYIEDLEDADQTPDDNFTSAVQTIRDWLNESESSKFSVRIDQDGWTLFEVQAPTPAPVQP